jgi:Na+-translocating ferredoxin:NAD+ oxidoreductase RnfG subunit
MLEFTLGAVAVIFGLLVAMVAFARNKRLRKPDRAEVKPSISTVQRQAEVSKRLDDAEKHPDSENELNTHLVDVVKSSRKSG